MEISESGLPSSLRRLRKSSTAAGRSSFSELAKSRAFESSASSSLARDSKNDLARSVSSKRRWRSANSSAEAPALLPASSARTLLSSAASASRWAFMAVRSRRSRSVSVPATSERWSSPWRRALSAASVWRSCSERMSSAFLAVISVSFSASIVSRLPASAAMALASDFKRSAMSSIDSVVLSSGRSPIDTRSRLSWVRRALASACRSAISEEPAPGPPPPRRLMMISTPSRPMMTNASMTAGGMVVLENGDVASSPCTGLVSSMGLCSSDMRGGWPRGPAAVNHRGASNRRKSAGWSNR